MRVFFSDIRSMALRYFLFVHGRKFLIVIRITYNKFFSYNTCLDNTYLSSFVKTYKKYKKIKGDENATS